MLPIVSCVCDYTFADLYVSSALTGFVVDFAQKINMILPLPILLILQHSAAYSAHPGAYSARTAAYPALPAAYPAHPEAYTDRPAAYLAHPAASETKHQLITPFVGPSTSR